jgi:acyl dehydratase
MPSIYFEDFAVGRVFELGSVTVTEKSIIEFASQFDPQSFHIDPEAAVDSSFGGLIASGWHTGSLWMRLYADALLLDADSRGSPGIEEVRWRAPVRPDDTLTGTRGTVFIESAMTNQDGVVVMTMKSRGMFGRRKA